MKVWEFVKLKMLEHPKQTVCENNAELSFESLVVWAEIFAKSLNGIKCCAILCRSEMSAAMALLGCFAAQVTALPLSVRYGELHCNKIIDTISPDAVISDNGGELQILHISDSKYITPETHPALIMCTSGTTGTPKGAMLSEDNIICNVSDITDYFNIDESDSILIARPLYHCAVLTGEFLTSLVKGTKIRFYSEKFNPAKMLEIIDEYNITAFCGTPTLLEMMARFKRGSSAGTLKHICISGECMSKETALHIAKAYPKSKIYHIYGLTEACPRVAFLPPEQFEKYPDYVGIPLKSVSIKIIGFDGNVCGKNEEGILWVKGGNVMLGYYNAPEKTKAVLCEGWLCTGDVAEINDAGFLKIKGRNDHMIIKSGMNIYPAEIESALKTDPRVSEVLAYGYKNAYGTQIGITIAGEFESIDEIKQLCAETLPAFQVPSHIELVKELRKNGSGKIVRGGAND